MIAPNVRAPSAARRFAGRAADALPTLAVLAAVAGLAWWGHRRGWAVPKFSALAAKAAVADDWCHEHAVPESACVECDPALMPRPAGGGWCREHGVHDCTLCRPALAQLAAPPAATAADRDRAARALAAGPRNENNPVCKLHKRRIQFASAAAAEKAGVAVEPAWAGPAVEAVAAPGEVVDDPTRVARLSARAPGSVWRVFKRVGDAVRPGELLALVEAAEVGRAKAEFLQASAQAALRERTLAGLKAGAGAVPERTIREAEAGLREARVRAAAARQALINLGLPPATGDGMTEGQLDRHLQVLGLPDEVARGLDPAATTSNLLPVRSPAGGVVASGDVVAGEVVGTDRVLFEVVDAARVWLTCDVRVEDAGRLRPGLPVRFRPDGEAAERSGELSWVSTRADHATRTVRVRAELPNDDGRLRANTFGAGRVVLREEPSAVLVPNEAVHDEGCCKVVFVRDRDYLKDGSPKVFHVRTVRVGVRTATHTEVIAGVRPGELVAAGGSGVLLAELLRGNLGEGCGCHSHK